MRFHKVAIQNFLSFGEPAEVLQLSDRGLVIVIGMNYDAEASDSNGAGKSSVMEAILWCLYGITMRNYKGDEVINHINKKNCFVELEIEDGDNIYLLKRTRKLSGKRPNDLQLTCNGNNITQGTNVETQRTVNTILGMSSTTFMQSVMLKHGHRSFSDMTDKEQKEVLEDILQIEQIGRARERIKARTFARQEQLVKTRADISAIARQLDEVQRRMHKIEHDKNQYAVILEQEKIGLKRKLVSVELKIEDIYEATGLDVLIALHEDLEKHIEESEKLEQEFQDKRFLISQEHAGKREKVATEEGAVKGRLQQITTLSMNINKMVGTECGTCGQPIAPDSAEKCLAEWEDEKTKLVKNLTSLQKKRDKAVAKEKEDTKEVRGLLARAQENTKTLRTQLMLSGEKMQKRSVALQSISDLEQEALQIQYEVHSRDASSNPYIAMFDEAVEEEQEMVKQTKYLKYREQALDIEIEHLNFWNHGFSNQGLKSYMIDHVLPFLTERAQKYADMISGGDLQIRFLPNKELKSGEKRNQFTVDVKNRNGADVYHGNSDGERGRINQAISWAFGDLAASRSHKSIRFKALDEPYENIDSTGGDLLMKLLHAVVPEYETIMCITHLTDLKNQFPSEVTVKKENGFSRFV